jgi:hypothetical protein
MRYISGPCTFLLRAANNVNRPKERPCPLIYKWSQPKRQRCRAQLQARAFKTKMTPAINVYTGV